MDIISQQFRYRIQSEQQQRMQKNTKDKEFLLKSKKTLDKLQYKISEVAKKINKPESILRTVQNTSHKIQSEIETKIEENFNKMLNSQTLVELTGKNQRNQDKKNAEQLLMDNYWQKVGREAKKKNMNKENMLPPLKQSQPDKNKKTAVLSSLNVKMYEREKELQNMIKQKEEKLLSYLYTYMVQIIEYKIQNDSTQFLMFQKSQYSKWDQIDIILKSIEDFCAYYQIKYCTLDLQKVLDLLDVKEKTTKKPKQVQFIKQKQIRYREKEDKEISIEFTPHQLLSCLENAEEISTENSHKKGLRFYGNKGKIRAIIKIQSAMRARLARKTCEQLRKFIRKIISIQRFVRVHLNNLQTKENIRTNSSQKYAWFMTNQKKFKSEYRLSQLTKKIKYQIHISSFSVSEWQRFSTQNYMERHNCEVTRIFRAVSNASIETRVIYVSPLPLKKQIVNYYFKLLELGGARNFERKITFMAYKHTSQLHDQLPLARCLYYECKTLKKIRSIIGDNYAYIVPSMPSIDFVHISHYLNLPLYSSEPQNLSFLQSKSGTKTLCEQIMKEDPQFNCLPFVKDVYCEEMFFNDLAKLIVENSWVKIWVLKIDNEFESRGIAYIDITKILSKRLLNTLKNKTQQPFNQYIFSETYQQLKYQFKQNTDTAKIFLISHRIYRDQAQFLQNFYINGGIIEAGANNLKSQCENLCITVQIQPDCQWKILGRHHKIEAQHRTVSCFFEQEDETGNFDNQIYINQKIDKIVKQLIKKQCFGFFTMDFLKFNPHIRPASSRSKDPYHFNGLKCYLDKYSSANFMRSFINPKSYALYLPLIIHDNIKKINISTFFHLCRLQNMSFDIEKKIGNIFMFVDGLESGCLGLMTFNVKSKIQTFIYACEVLEFFCSKTMNKTDAENEQFVLIKSAINGYINRMKRKGKILDASKMVTTIKSLKYC